MPMKTLLLVYGTAILAAGTAGAQSPGPPKVAPPVSTPRPGMEWKINIRPAQAEAGESTVRISGRSTVSGSAWTVHFPGEDSREYFLSDGRLFAWNAKSNTLSTRPLRDGQHDEALSHEVSALPGLGWVKPDLKPSVEQDREGRQWRAVYVQEAKPFKIVNEGTPDEYAMPTGPSVGVTARFDAATGLPVAAEVAGKIYTYAVNPQGEGELTLSPGFREAIETRIRREAALHQAIEREEKRRK
jgi:hypothetical protein